MAETNLTDEELLELYPATIADQEDAFAFARAVLARYGHQPAPPELGLGRLERLRFTRGWWRLLEVQP